MPKAWTDKKEYHRLKSTLYELTGRELERAVLPLVHLLYPAAMQTFARKQLDRSGIDLLAWGDGQLHSLVLQCKGFQVLEQEVANDQLRQCLASIEAYRASGIRTQHYVFFYNRDARDPVFRRKLSKALNGLVESGQADAAEQWALDRLLQVSFGAMFERVTRIAQSRSISARDVLDRFEPEGFQTLAAVPVETSTIVADQYRLQRTSAPEIAIADPVDVLLSRRTPLTVLVGEAGFGKTTAALRACESSTRRAVYMPAALFSARLSSTKDLVEQAVDMDVLLADASHEDRTVWQQLARAAVEHLFKTDDRTLLLILDGLDESVFFLRQGGLQHLLNALRLFKTPVVLTTRTEHWEARQSDFASSFGIVTGHPDKRRNQRISVVRLLPWSVEQMVALSRSYRTSLKDRRATRVDEFIRLLESGQYGTVYGDIPQRPLFLRWILETVAECGVHTVTRARLLEEFAILKIKRDIERPVLFGGRRLEILPGIDGLDAALELGFSAMQTAAREMTLVDGDKMELQASCSLNAVLDREPRLRQLGDGLSLFLSSLLVPAAPHRPTTPLDIRFAHRAYQEFFLARYLVRHPDERQGLAIPPAITAWIEQLEREMRSEHRTL